MLRFHSFAVLFFFFKIRLAESIIFFCFYAKTKAKCDICNVMSEQKKAKITLQFIMR